VAKRKSHHELEDDCMVTGVGAVVRRGGDGAEEGEGWVSVAECRFREENERQMTGSNGMETMTMERN
jgi:hypothetical protein